MRGVGHRLAGICGPVTCRGRLVHPLDGVVQLLEAVMAALSYFPRFRAPFVSSVCTKAVGLDASTCCYRFLSGGWPMQRPFYRLTIAHGFLPNL
jgi:hypothetical protein